MRWAIAVESAASLSAGAVIAEYLPPSGKTVSLRRLVVGGRGASASGQVTAAVIYAEGAGTPSGNPGVGQPIGAGQYLGNNSSEGNAYGVFTSDPVYGSYPLYELSFNSGGGSEKLEWKEFDFVCQGDEGNNGFVLYTVADVPDGFLFTVSFEFDVA